MLVPARNEKVRFGGRDPGPWDSHPALQHYRKLVANPVLFTILKNFCVWYM